MIAVIFGATSVVGQKLALEYGRQGFDVALAGRDLEEIEHIAADVAVRREVQTWAFRFDAEETDTHGEIVREIESMAGPIEVACLVFGDMGDQSEPAQPEALRKIVEVNFLGAATLAEALAQTMSTRSQGSIVGISSVAGDRGRQKNYHYGSAKGAFTLFLQGLRNRLFADNVHVLTVRLGFVDTRMTYGQESPIPSADPTEIATAIYRAQQNGEEDIYLPRFWKGIMGIIKTIPERYFKRLNF